MLYWLGFFPPTLSALRLAFLGYFPSALSFLIVSVILAWISFPTLSVLVVETLSLLPLPAITPFFGRMVFAVLVPMGSIRFL